LVGPSGKILCRLKFAGELSVLIIVINLSKTMTRFLDVIVFIPTVSWKEVVILSGAKDHGNTMPMVSVWE